MQLLDEHVLNTLKWDQDGLIAAIIQDHSSKDVLMMAWMNRESLQKTLEIGETVFYSRSRATLWHKGETSGHTQRVIAMHVDCDADVLLIQVEANGPACHTNNTSCFFRTMTDFAEKPEQL
ncbi:MAG: phosphoribosyl-AMP cyclohydrolase [Anaerolineaceae bacterium]|nr:phosphoribosyl-AMP cyclohydrolase [Anaerolineaceae bacterium]